MRIWLTCATHIGNAYVSIPYGHHMTMLLGKCGWSAILSWVGSKLGWFVCDTWKHAQSQRKLTNDIALVWIRSVETWWLGYRCRRHKPHQCLASFAGLNNRCAYYCDFILSIRAFLLEKISVLTHDFLAPDSQHRVYSTVSNVSYHTVEEFNVDSKAECNQLDLVNHSIGLTHCAFDSDALNMIP